VRRTSDSEMSLPERPRPPVSLCLSRFCRLITSQFAPHGGAKYCACLSVCPLAFLENYTAKLDQSFVRVRCGSGSVLFAHWGEVCYLRLLCCTMRPPYHATLMAALKFKKKTGSQPYKRTEEMRKATNITPLETIFQLD